MRWAGSLANQNGETAFAAMDAAAEALIAIA
jgi:hypothetical protein